MKQRLNHLFAVLLATTTLFGVAACNGSSDAPSSPAAINNSNPSNDTGSIPKVDSKTQGRLQSYTTDALIYAGNGVWAAERTNVEALLTKHGKTWKEATEADLNSMSVAELATFGMIVWPGGSGTSQMAGLTSVAMANLRTAVQEYGVGYIGFCAGAFAAVTPMDVLAGPTLNYYHLEYEGIYNAVVDTRWADGSTHHLLWYGGPVTPDGAGIVLARYADTGEPAVSQIWSGRGLAIITGPHPGMPQSVAQSLGLNDPDGLDEAITWKLLNATLTQQPLPTF